jgi:hypothetical protein
VAVLVHQGHADARASRKRVADTLGKQLHGTVHFLLGEEQAPEAGKGERQFIEGEMLWHGGANLLQQDTTVLAVPPVEP